MASTVIICEKPSQARLVAQALGISEKVDGAFVDKDSVVTWGYGHMLELAMPDEYLDDSQWKIEDLPLLPETWLMRARERTIEQYERIGSFLSSAKKAVIATDPDEEGETIGRTLLESFGFNGQVKRLWVNSLEQNSLKRALFDLQDIKLTDYLYRAGKIRRELDWLIGTNLTRWASIKVGRGGLVNIGRVKSRIIKAIADRENEILKEPPPIDCIEWEGRQFAPTPQWDGNVPKTGLMIMGIESREVHISPPLPFSLTALLVSAARHGFGLQEAYAAIQNLYEAGVISYPRTSSTELPVASPTAFANHHAITISSLDTPAWLSGAEATVFMILRENAVFHELGAGYGVSEEITLGDGERELFVSSRVAIQSEEQAGWLLCKPELLQSMMEPLLELSQGDICPVVPTRKLGAPSCRFSESSLLEHMDKNNIGTDATRVGFITEMKSAGILNENENGELSLSGRGRMMSESIPDALVQEMERRVSDAVSRSRKADVRESVLIETAKWLSRTIHARNDV